MDFLELAKSRCSVREYSDKQVESDKVNIILECARVCPTAVNYQPQIILKITAPAQLEKLQSSATTFGAPLVFVVCSDKNLSWTRKLDNKSMIDTDGTIAADHMVMCAESLGLSSCWITYFRPEVLRRDFNIPDNVQPIAIIAVGYASGQKKSADRHDVERRALSSMIVENTF